MVFVVDKSLIVIIFMYAIGTMVLAGQYLIGDVFGFQLISPVTGVPMKSTFLTQIIDTNHLQTIEQNATTTQRTDFISNLCNSFTLGACNQVEYWGNVFFDIFQILTGTEIWQILVFFGIPGIVALAILTPYYILLFRAIIGYAKNFF